MILLTASSKSHGQHQRCLHLTSSGKADTAVNVAKSLNLVNGVSVSPSTVRRRLDKAGFRAVVKKKSLLSARHRRERLDFALAYQYWTVQD